MSYQKYFNRFELKYQISLKERDKIIQFARPFMKLDPHVQNGHDYEIRSLYFDSPFGHAMIEKQNGVAIRKKLRIRYYPEFSKCNDQDIAFIEIKKKNYENVGKCRIIVPLENASSIIDYNSPEAEDFYQNANKQDQNTLNEIWYLKRKLQLTPVCVVSYKRQPFFSKFERTFRLTFDTNLLVKNSNYDLKQGGGSKYILPRNMCVMEIKFNNFIPNWAIKILQKHDCVQYKISKFANGLDKTHHYVIT